MKLAIIGSRTVTVENIGKYIPDQVTEIVSGGARGVDAQAAEYAKMNDIPLTEFLPDYAHFKRGAPLKRNIQIADYADGVLAFWDGKSRGTQHTLNLFKERNKPILIKIIDRTH